MRCCFDNSLPSVRIVSANMQRLQTIDFCVKASILNLGIERNK